MFDRMIAHGFQNIEEADDVAFDVDIGMIDRITHAGLSRQVDHDIEMIFVKQIIDKRLVGNIPSYKGKILVQFFDLSEPVFLK